MNDHEKCSAGSDPDDRACSAPVDSDCATNQQKREAVDEDEDGIRKGQSHPRLLVF